MSTLNFIFDLILIAASVWMVYIVRGLGGVIGRGLNLITAGIVILGIGHFLATGLTALDVNNTIDGPTESLIHRVIVLGGFLVLLAGFRRIGQIRR